MASGQEPAGSFAAYQARALATARAVFNDQPQHATDEQAGPMYLQALAISRWIFWKRLALTHRLLAARRGSAALDFGCGFGLLLPFLAERFERVFGVDLQPQFAQDFLNRWAASYGERPANITLGTQLADLWLADRSLDVILALDVLEHVEDLPEVLRQMERVLKPDGLLLVSGPTENWMYRLGRRIGQRVAGPEFSGDYHKRNIYGIQRDLEQVFAVRVVRRLVFPLTFFVLLSARPRAAAVPASGK